jgi:hypothetical protein
MLYPKLSLIFTLRDGTTFDICQYSNYIEKDSGTFIVKCPLVTPELKKFIATAERDRDYITRSTYGCELGNFTNFNLQLVKCNIVDSLGIPTTLVLHFQSGLGECID